MTLISFKKNKQNKNITINVFFYIKNDHLTFRGGACSLLEQNKYVLNCIDGKIK
jgi:hypothetical protein